MGFDFDGEGVEVEFGHRGWLRAWYFDIEIDEVDVGLNHSRCRANTGAVYPADGF